MKASESEFVFFHVFFFLNFPLKAVNLVQDLHSFPLWILCALIRSPMIILVHFKKHTNVNVCTILPLARIHLAAACFQFFELE